MIDATEHADWAAQFWKAKEIWDEPQFLVADVCAITGATPKAIEHFVNPARGLVRLHGTWVNPGTGKRRMFTGGQVLMIAAAYKMNHIGFPQKFSATLAETIERRAKNLIFGLEREKQNYTIATYPMKGADDWALKVLYEGMPEEPKLPIAVQLLQVDRLIAEVRSQLMAIVAGDELPDFSIPDPAPEPNPYSPNSNFFRAWDKDEQGRWIYVGLNFEETQELLALQGSRIEDGELIAPDERRHKTNEERSRYLELHDRHEIARLKIVGNEVAGEG
ncbi:hypothetical protein [Paracoccus spongiarum]|uniref:Uncharacterized protein n=1 Tax=Paracoccus spongiarum TaxID=3064387 RepID=A0ABT9JGD6_9RHOB|nr:hypothetical protein [Paracoccus sp. 2205BS29-5]MDP5308878.1 hypothetical protein [Paracoccus sp. 2205BS29-5]